MHVKIAFLYLKFICILQFLVIAENTETKTCGISKPGDIVRRSIISHQEYAKAGTWPWMVAIRIRESPGVDKQWCSGFLIDRIHVITAADCFDRKNFGLYITRVGNVNQDEGEEYIITQFQFPSEYKKGSHYGNIVLLTLNRKVNIPNFNPICLPGDHFIKKNFTGKEATLVGWGSDATSTSFDKFLKQENKVLIIPNKECEQRYHYILGNSSEYIICTSHLRQRDRGDICQGAIGAPLMYRKRNQWYAIGVLSFCQTRGIRRVTSVYANISTFLHWIKQKSRN